MSHKPVVSGCIIQEGDAKNILSSVSCFVSFIVYGASVAALGAAIPELAHRFSRSESSFGLCFTTRGVGYLCGTFLAAFILEFKILAGISKEMCTAIAVCICGIATGSIMAVDEDFSVVLFLFWLQGLAFGGIDTMANCVLPELWGSRVQPWMQALHSCFGIGAFIGPALVGGIGSRNAFVIIGLAAALPMIGLATQSMIFGTRKSPEIIQVKEQSANADDSSKLCDAKEDEYEVIEYEGNLEKNNPIVTKPMPFLIKLLIVSFFFVYVGTEVGYGINFFEFVSSLFYFHVILPEQVDGLVHML